MNDLKMTLHQIKNETKKAFEDGYDHPEDFGGCTDASGQEFQCCGTDCPTCNGNTNCPNTSNNESSNCTCSCSCNGYPSENNSNPTCCNITNCPNDNLESCIYEKRWEMMEHTPPKTITDETGTNIQYIKVIRITRNYRSK